MCSWAWNLGGAGGGEEPGREAACFLSSPSIPPFLSCPLRSLPKSLSSACSGPGAGNSRNKASYVFSFPPSLSLLVIASSSRDNPGLFPGPDPAPSFVPPPPPLLCSASPLLPSPPHACIPFTRPHRRALVWLCPLLPLALWLFLPSSEPSGCFQVVFEVRVRNRTWGPPYSSD